jgi:hypothetical protein
MNIDLPSNLLLQQTATPPAERRRCSASQS